MISITFRQLLTDRLLTKLDSAIRNIKMDLPDIMAIGELIEDLEPRKGIALKYPGISKHLWADDPEGYEEQNEIFLNMTALEIEPLSLTIELPEDLQFLTEEV